MKLTREEIWSLQDAMDTISSMASSLGLDLSDVKEEYNNSYDEIKAMIEKYS